MTPLERADELLAKCKPLVGGELAAEINKHLSRKAGRGRKADKDQIRGMMRKGKSAAEMAEVLKCHQNAVRRVVAELRAEVPVGPVCAEGLILHIATDAPTETGRTILAAGSVVRYLGHVTGGMVRVETSDGAEEVIHPNTIKELQP